MEPSHKQASLVREAWTRTRKFVLPDEIVSMKTIFDNLRNYLVCGGVVLAVGVLGPSTAAGASMLIAFSLVLIAVNTLQSWLIIQIWLGRIGRFQSEVRPRWGRFKRRTFRIVLFLVLLLPLAGMLQGYGLLIRWALAGGK